MPRTTELHQTSRIWIERFDRWRHEIDVPGKAAAVTVVDRDVWWSYWPDVLAVTNEADPGAAPAPADPPYSGLLSPISITAGLSLERGAVSSHVGRDATAFRGVASGETHPELPVGADVYDILVDHERDVVVRISASVDREEFFRLDVTDIEFDPRSDPRLFTLELPVGVSFAPAPTHVGTSGTSLSRFCSFFRHL